MLAVQDLTVAYGDVVAVRGLDLEVAEGEMVGLIGHNGAGKSTTLMTIAGAVKPASGQITFAGESIVGQKPERILDRGVVLVPERRRIFTRLTVDENLQIATSSRRDRAAAKADVKSAIERFPQLGGLRERPAGLLSGGEQQQLAIARALICRPRLLMLDEPSLGLAPKIVDQIFELLAELHREGTTILLIEQNAARTVDLVDRFYVLRAGGRVGFKGSRDDIADPDAFQAEYLGFKH